ncbi:MAG: Fic family protein [bacterium]|nr:Fic family protein [bacterium]
MDFTICDNYAKRINAMRPFPKETLRSLRNYYRIGLAYTSNALEGSSLTESETKVVIEDGLTVGGKPLREIYEATGHATAYDFLFSLAKDQPLTEDILLKLHALFYQKIDAENAGVWRTVRVFLSGSRKVLPAPEEVPALMQALIQWIAENEHTYHPVEFAARLHQKFVYIHPFVDGNGRMARLLMNFVLMRASLTPAIIPPICRHEYILTLDQADKAIHPFIAFIRDRVIETQKELLRLFGQSIEI